MVPISPQGRMPSQTLHSVREVPATWLLWGFIQRAETISDIAFGVGRPYAALAFDAGVFGSYGMGVEIHGQHCTHDDVDSLGKLARESGACQQARRRWCDRARVCAMLTHLVANS